MKQRHSILLLVLAAVPGTIFAPAMLVDGYLSGRAYAPRRYTWGM